MITNAKIISTMLGYEDHGILTCMLHVEFNGGAVQGFGGYALDEYNSVLKERIPIVAAGKWIKGILETVGVDRWERLSGKYIRIDTSSKINRIGNIIEDKWFDPNENS